MKVCIIVPIYNAGKYLKRCILSLIGQSHTDLEIILVNDGSKDNSKEICDNFQKKDSRIKVIHKKNEGQSIARNIGMEFCTSPYLTFVDSDDILFEDAIADLAAPLYKKEYDITCGLYRCIGKKGSKKMKFHFDEGEIDRNPCNQKRFHHFKTESIFGYVWGKLYKTSFLKQRGLLFDDIRKYFMEDTLFNLKAFACKPDYYITSKIVYEYHVYDNTSSNQKLEDVEKRIRNSIYRYLDYLESKHRVQEEIDLIIPLIVRMFCWSMIHNAPFEGISYKKLKQKAQLFISDRKIYQLLKGKQARKAIAEIPDLMQRTFYRYCLTLIKWKWGAFLSLTFFILYPVMQLYVKINLNK